MYLIVNQDTAIRWEAFDDINSKTGYLTFEEIEGNLWGTLDPNFLTKTALYDKKTDSSDKDVFIEARDHTQDEFSVYIEGSIGGGERRLLEEHFNVEDAGDGFFVSIKKFGTSTENIRDFFKAVAKSHGRKDGFATEEDLQKNSETFRLFYSKLKNNFESKYKDTGVMVDVTKKVTHEMSGAETAKSLGVSLGSAATGAYIGGFIGSAVPVLGTAVGALIGGALFGLGGELFNQIHFEDRADLKLDFWNSDFSELNNKDLAITFIASLGGPLKILGKAGKLAKGLRWFKRAEQVEEAAVTAERVARASQFSSRVKKGLDGAKKAGQVAGDAFKSAERKLNKFKTRFPKTAKVGRFLLAGVTGGKSEVLAGLRKHGLKTVITHPYLDYGANLLTDYWLSQGVAIATGEMKKEDFAWLGPIGPLASLAGSFVGMDIGGDEKVDSEDTINLATSAVLLLGAQMALRGRFVSSRPSQSSIKFPKNDRRLPFGFSVKEGMLNGTLKSPGRSRDWGRILAKMEVQNLSDAEVAKLQRGLSTVMDREWGYIGNEVKWALRGQTKVLKASRLTHFDRGIDDVAADIIPELGKKGFGSKVKGLYRNIRHGNLDKLRQQMNDVKDYLAVLENNLTKVHPDQVAKHQAEIRKIREDLELFERMDQLITPHSDPDLDRFRKRVFALWSSGDDPETQTRMIEVIRAEGGTVLSQFAGKRDEQNIAINLLRIIERDIKV